MSYRLSDSVSADKYRGSVRLRRCFYLFSHCCVLHSQRNLLYVHRNLRWRKQNGRRYDDNVSVKHYSRCRWRLPFGYQSLDKWKEIWYVSWLVRPLYYGRKEYLADHEECRYVRYQRSWSRKRTYLYKGYCLHKALRRGCWYVNRFRGYKEVVSLEP